MDNKSNKSEDDLNNDKQVSFNNLESNIYEHIAKKDEQNSQNDLQNSDDLDIDNIINSNYQFFYLDSNTNLNEPYDYKIEHLSHSDSESQNLKSNDSTPGISKQKYKVNSDLNTNNENIEDVKINVIPQNLNEKTILSNDNNYSSSDVLNTNINNSNTLISNYFIDVNQPMSSKMATNLDKQFALMQKNFFAYQKFKNQNNSLNINFQFDSNQNNLNSSILNQKRISNSISQFTSSNENYIFKPEDLINTSNTNSVQYSMNCDQNKNIEYNTKYHPYKDNYRQDNNKQTNSSKTDNKNYNYNHSKDNFDLNQNFILNSLSTSIQEENNLIEPVVERSKEFRSKYVLSPKPIYQKTTYSNIIGQHEYNNYKYVNQITGYEENIDYEAQKNDLNQIQENLKVKNKSPIKSIENQSLNETKTSNQYNSPITHKTRPKRFDVLELIIGKFHLQSMNVVPVNSPNKKPKINEEYSAKMKVVFNKQRFIYEFCIQASVPNCESDSNNSCFTSSNQNQSSNDQNLVTYENHFYVMIIPFSFLDAINIEADNVRLLVNKQPYLFLGNVSQRTSGHVSFSNLNDSINSNCNENENGLYVNLNKSLNEVYPSTVFNGVNPNYNFKIPLNYNNERDPTYGECHCNALHILKLASGQTQRLKSCLINYTNFLENNHNSCMKIDFNKLFEKKISKYIENYVYDLEKVQWVDSEEQVQRYDLYKNQQIPSFNLDQSTGKSLNSDIENYYKRKRSNSSNKELFLAKKGLYSNENESNLIKNHYYLTSNNNNYGLNTPVCSSLTFPSTSSVNDSLVFKNRINEPKSNELIQSSNKNLLTFNQTTNNFSGHNQNNYYVVNNTFPYGEQNLPYPILNQSQQRFVQNTSNISNFSSLNLNYTNYQPPFFAPTILRPIDRKKFESRRPCECTQKCAKGQCSCYQSGRVCIYFQQNSCTCSSCENPLNLLSLHEVDINRALEDSCLTYSLPQVSYNNLQTTLCKILYTPCCNNQVTLPQVIPNIKMCPTPGCNKTLRFSWCRKTLVLNSSNIFHCEHCNNCETFIGGRCKICRIAKLDLFIDL